jgi:broad specificity phosphatase PhoE
MIQGAYDAAKADPGKRAQAGLEGAAVGAAFVGTLAGVGPLWRYLHSFGVGEEQAKAVEAVAKGLGSDADHTLAQQALLETPYLDEKIQAFVRQQTREWQRTGRPDGASVDNNFGNLRLDIQGADGKVYSLGQDQGAPLNAFDQIISRIGEHLDQGGKVVGMSGDPVTMQSFMLKLERANPKAFTYVDPDGIPKPNDTLWPIRTSPEYEDWWQQQPQTRAELEQDVAERWKSHDQLRAEAEGQELLGQPVQFGQAQSDVLPGTNRGRIVFRSAPLDAASIPEGEARAERALPNLWTKQIQQLFAEGRSIRQIAWEENISEGEVSKVLERSLPPSSAILEKGLTRGSTDMPLNGRGDAQTKLLGRQLANQFDIIIPGSRLRAQQTAANLAESNPMSKLADPNPALDSWRRGKFEGGDPEVAKKYSDSLVLHAPDTPHPGVSQFSGAPGESFNQFAGRVVPFIDSIVKLQKETLPEKTIGLVTHYNPIHLYDSHLRADNWMDFEHFIGEEREPGYIYKVEDGGLRKIDPSGAPTLDPGVYLIRHGETDWSARPKTLVGESPFVKETPFVRRVFGTPDDINKYSGEEFPPETYGMVPTSPAGKKPYMLLNKEQLAANPDEVRGTVWHEGLHAHFSYLDMSQWIHDLGDTDKEFYRGMYSGFLKQMGYSKWLVPEETYTYASQFIRHGYNDGLQLLINADTDKETFLNWYTDTSKAIMEKIAPMEDSLHKRTLERRLNFTTAQASNMMRDVEQPFNQKWNVHFDAAQRQWVAESQVDGARFVSPDRGSLLNHLSADVEPLNAPELVDTDGVPPNLPRYAKEVPPPSMGQRPLTTDPPPPLESPKAGWLALRGWITPFYDWVGAIGKKYDRMDLPAAFDQVRGKWTDFQLGIEPFAKTLKETLAQYPENRQPDFLRWLQADTPEAETAVQQEFRFSAEELAHLHEFKQQFGQLDGFMDFVREQLPKVASHDHGVEMYYPKEYDKSMVGELLRRGIIDPKEDNLANIAFNYMRGQMFHQHMKDAIDSAEALVDEEAASGMDKYTFQMVRPLLKRQIEYYRGQPDYTQKVVLSAVEQTVDWINKGIGKVNSALPESMQIPTLDSGPRDILGKFIMYNYAGALALRPAVPIRDALGYFLTTYPLLGEKYMWQGMKRAYSTLREGWTDSDSYQLAREYGALLNRENFQELIAGGGEQQQGKLADWTQKAMSAITFSQNTKRVAAFWGFAEKVSDALASYSEHGDGKRFLKDSGLWFLNDSRTQNFLREASVLTEAGEEAQRKFAFRAARDMVDATQWDYSKGAAPGIYKYQLGRLLGQYGTWPLNYIEYFRKFATNVPSEYKAEAAMGLTRLALAHGAILQAGRSVGVDVSKWTFSQPMAYSGGPIYNSVINIPQSMDFQTYKGVEARRQIIEPIWPGMLPGYDEAHGVWRAVVDDEPNAWIRILGFQPYKEK